MYVHNVRTNTYIRMSVHRVRIERADCGQWLLHLQVQIEVSTYVRSTYVLMYICTYVHIYIRMCTHTFMRVYKITQIHTYTHTQTHTPMLTMVLAEVAAVVRAVQAVCHLENWTNNCRICVFTHKCLSLYESA